MRPQESCSIAVIGGGILGCSIAYELSIKGYSIVVLEKEPRIAEGITSRNSGVIHAGLYYSPNSLKAQSCIRGKNLLYEWCEQYRVSYRNTGKWIVGQKDEEEEELEALFANAQTSGATGVRVGKKEELEKLNATGILGAIGLFSSETGIVDPFEYTRSFQIKAEENGALFIMDAEVKGLQRLSSGSYQLETTRGSIESEVVVNAAGLHSDEVNAFLGYDQDQIFPYRGDYFKLKSRENYKHLVYPIKKKNAPGLGIHLTINLDGSYRLGPDVEVVSSKIDFLEPKNLEEKRISFFNSASKYLKNIELQNLEYDFCGLRPKLRKPGETKEKDFLIKEVFPGFIALLGIESPGLTAARDLAQRVVNQLDC